MVADQAVDAVAAFEVFVLGKMSVFMLGENELRWIRLLWLLF